MHYLAIKPVALLDIITAEEKYTKETIVNLLNTRNSESKTPLHLACEEDKPEMVTAMMIQGADFNILSSSDDVTDQDSPKKAKLDASSASFKDILALYPKGLYVKDIKLGGTPLHWSQDNSDNRSIWTIGWRQGGFLQG